MDKLYHYTHYGEDTRVEGMCNDIHGNLLGLYGDCTHMRGDVSGLTGDCTGLGGYCTGIFGDLDSVEFKDRVACQFQYKWIGNYVGYLLEAELDVPG
tara:strand:- start:4687 stop:4977 length:291 start_codon:yes stop_codon:yes gene_type:complete